MSITLKEYLTQKTPSRMPKVVLKESEYRVAGFYKVKGELRQRVYVVTQNPIVAGIEYCLIGNYFYTVDSDGNAKNKSIFSIK